MRFYDNGPGPRNMVAEPPPAHRATSVQQSYQGGTQATPPPAAVLIHLREAREREERERERIVAAMQPGAKTQQQAVRRMPPQHHPGNSSVVIAGHGMPSHGSLVPAMPGQTRSIQVATPPHASQVPPQGDSLLSLLQRYPVMWQGMLALKNDQAAVQMHFVHGNRQVAQESLPCNNDGSQNPPLRIAQRMRLEPQQIDGVVRKMQVRKSLIPLLLT